MSRALSCCGARVSCWSRWIWERTRHAKAEWLSGGQAQRAAIARALVNDPDVILADEPTANLDTELSQRFLDIARDLKRQGKTLIMTSHDPLVYQAPEVDRVISLRDGHLA